MIYLDFAISVRNLKVQNRMCTAFNETVTKGQSRM